MCKKIAVIDYGSGNLFSVCAAFHRLGIETNVTANKEEILNSEWVIFPGVGHAEFAVNNLKKDKLFELIPDLKQKVLGICLGMQLMCRFSEEGGVDGLGIFDDVDIIEFGNELLVPHMGWNSIENTKGSLRDVNGDFYFVHSYYANLSRYTIATASYPFEFSAALEKDNFLGCQFHPEKSGDVGETVLRRFLNI